MELATSTLVSARDKPRNSISPEERDFQSDKDESNRHKMASVREGMAWVRKFHRKAAAEAQGLGGDPGTDVYLSTRVIARNRVVLSTM